AKGTVRPSDKPITISCSTAELVRCCSRWSIGGMGAGELGEHPALLRVRRWQLLRLT
nr:hypothetical protein [Tanacetum cinerariifolium]